MSWMGRISQNRVQAQGQQGLRKQEAVGKADPAKFAETMISDRVLKRYGNSLAPAAGDMQAIARAGQGLKTHRAAQFANAVDQFYSSLGRSTDHLDDGKKEQVIKASVSAMRQLVEGQSQHPALMPAMAALSSLLEPRGQLTISPEKHAETAKTTVQDLLGRFEARLGTTSMLFGFRNLVEAYEAGRDGLKASERPKIWQAVTDYLDAVVPRPGCDQGQLGVVAGLFLKALRDNPDSPAKALNSAKAKALAPYKEGHKAALEQLKVVPANLQAGTPAMAAFDAMSGALSSVIKDNPAGPERLTQAVEQVQGKLAQCAAQANNEQLATGYKNLAKLIATAGTTSAAITVLEHVAQQMPNIVVHAGSRAIIDKAARIQKPESLAPLLVEAHLARQNRNAAQNKMVEPLEKLKRLPPGPALRAAVALLPQIVQAHAPQLAEALFVESRVAESAEDLNDFVQRFSAAFPQLRNLGADAGPVAAAMAKDGTGALDVQAARQLANLVTQAKAALPHTPIAKLLDRGKNGEAGLMALANVKDFIHNPVNMALDLLRTVNVANPNKEAVGDARVALHLAAEMGRFDRNPQNTDFPRVKADFQAAMQKPQDLTCAKGAMKNGAPPTSMQAFLSAHSDFPPEVAMTASAAFDEPRMSWLQDELTSTRSHAYKRVLRDAIYAATGSQHAYFFTVLAESPSDRKAKEAALNLIADNHRQGHAAQIPWDALIDGLKQGGDPATDIESAKAQEAMAGIGLDGVDKLDPVGMSYLQKSNTELQALLTFLSQDQYGKPKEFFLDKLKTAVKAQAEGTWPAPKYESASAKEHLAPLKPEQLEAWKRNTVTGANQVVQVDDPESAEALQLLKGVSETLTQHISVTGPGFEKVKWNAASLKDLRGQQEALLGQLRDAKKGSAEHRALSKKIGPIRSRVALLELQEGLNKHFADGAMPGNPQAALAELKPLAVSAMSPLRAQGATGFIDALDTAAAAVKEVAGPEPRSGNYACDDDTLDAYLTAFAGGCIHPVNGFNRGSLIELIAGSQYKMIRAMKDDKPVGRSFLRLVRVEMANGYKGMALRMDPPQASSGGRPGNPEKAMMYKHALAKAVSMGVPLMVSDNSVQAAVQERGLQLSNQKAKVYVHKGETGMHHNQGMWNADYFIAWAGIKVGQGGPKPAENDKECARDYTFQTVMPPDWKA